MFTVTSQEPCPRALTKLSTWGSVCECEGPRTGEPVSISLFSPHAPALLPLRKVFEDTEKRPTGSKMRAEKGEVTAANGSSKGILGVSSQKGWAARPTQMNCSGNFGSELNIL